MQMSRKLHFESEMRSLFCFTFTTNEMNQNKTRRVNIFCLNSSVIINRVQFIYADSLHPKDGLLTILRVCNES